MLELQFAIGEILTGLVIVIGLYFITRPKKVTNNKPADFISYKLGKDYGLRYKAN